MLGNQQIISENINEMKKRTRKTLVLIFSLMAYNIHAQMGIGTNMPHPSAQLEIEASDKGLLIPRISLTSNIDQTTITTGNTESLLVYNTTSSSTLQPGYYYWYEDHWTRLVNKDDLPGNLNGNLPDNIVVWKPDDQQFMYIDGNGDTHLIDLEITEETLTTLTLNSDGKTLEYKDENGDISQIDLKTVVQNNQNTVSVSAGQNIVVDSSNSGNHTHYTVNVPTAQGATNSSAAIMGVVKEAGGNPSVLIDQNGTLSVNMQRLNAIKVITHDYTPTLSDRIILGQAIAGDVTITLPNPTVQKGKKYTIKKDDTNENYYINVTGNIAGLGGQNLYTALPYSGWDFVSDGTQWHIVHKF